MSSASAVDRFIEHSAALLEARPVTTRTTTVYKHQKIKKSKLKSSDPSLTRHAVLVAKTYDPVSGTCFKIKTSKVNELARLWAALGPKGVLVTKKDNGKSDNSTSHYVRGFASIMAGVDVEYEDDTKVDTQQASTTSNSGTIPGTKAGNKSGNKTKKKGSKK